MVIPSHISVLTDEVIQHLSPEDNKTYIDATFGAGGHSKKILEKALCKVIGIDRDESVKTYAESLKNKFNERFSFKYGNFSDLNNIIDNNEKIDGILMDIGVSSMQLDENRGFSFMRDEKLDMRMDKQQSQTAEDVVNNLDEKELADKIYIYGGEKKSRRIAKAITEARKNKPISTTLELAEIIKKSVGRYNDSIHPATRTFQAIRIIVNNELYELEEGLKQSAQILEKGGKLLVITFHSGEDRIVKEFFQKLAGKNEFISKYSAASLIEQKQEKNFTILTKKAVKPTEEEIKKNPRSRSAKLRALLKN